MFQVALYQILLPTVVYAQKCTYFSIKPLLLAHLVMFFYFNKKKYLNSLFLLGQKYMLNLHVVQHFLEIFL